MSNPEQIENYLQQFETSLRGLNPEDRADVLAEIRSHLFERAEHGEAATAAALGELGTPHKLARVYPQEYNLSAALSRQTPRQLLAALLRVVKRNTRAAIFAGVACCFYFFAVASSGIAFLKPLAPDGLPGFIGKFGLGGMARTPQAMDVLGWALIPIGVALAVVSYLCGTALLRSAARRTLRY